MRLALVILVLLLLTSPFAIAALIGSATSGPVDDRPVADASWRVIGIVDGDTLDVRAPDATEERIRVVGIDTPERGECGYAEASDVLAGLVLGEDVVLTAGARDDRDRYGRLLRYVDVAVGEVASSEAMAGGLPVDETGRQRIDAGLVLLERGLAVARYDSRDGHGSHPREAVYVAADAGASNPGCAS